MERRLFDVVMPQDDRMMAFFRGQMTGEQESSFISDLRNDEDLKDAVLSVARLAKGLKQVGMRNDADVKSALWVTSKQNLKDLLDGVTWKDELYKDTGVRYRRIRLEDFEVTESDVEPAANDIKPVKTKNYGLLIAFVVLALILVALFLILR